MKMEAAWTEVITVRSNYVKAELLATTLKDLRRAVDREGGLGRIRIYQRERIDTDFSLVLFHDHEKHATGPSRLGERLSDSLKELGQVHHTVWLTMDLRDADPHGKTLSP